MNVVPFFVVICAIQKRYGSVRRSTCRSSAQPTSIPCDGKILTHSLFLHRNRLNYCHGKQEYRMVGVIDGLECNTILHPLPCPYVPRGRPYGFRSGLLELVAHSNWHQSIGVDSLAPHHWSADFKNALVSYDRLV